MEQDPLNCGNKQMIYDQACLHLLNAGQSIVDIYYRSTECYKCRFEPLVKLGAGETRTNILSATFGTTLQFTLNNCQYEDTYFFGQHGHYGLNISKNDASELIELIPPDNANAPLYSLLWTLMIGWTLWGIGSCIFVNTQFYHRLFQSTLIINEAENDLGTISRSGENTPLLQETVRNTRTRIQSLDVFRGITITLLLFVQQGGGKYWFFQHSSWNGLTVADVVYPWFAWIMGTSIMLSLSSQLRNSFSRKRISLKVISRSLVLIAIGIILNSIQYTNYIPTFRYMGVLQRLGLAYFIVGSVETVFIAAQNRYHLTGRMKEVEDWINGWVQWFIMLILIGIYYYGTFCINVPGCPQGYLGPGGAHLNGTVFNCTGGSAGYIDRIVFSTEHLFNGTDISAVYHNKIPFDPEGLLGTLTTAFTVFLGVHAGRIILCYRTPRGRIFRWLIMAFVTGALAGHLCGWSKEDGSMPVNKNLWSISFALATSSLAFFMKSILFVLIDCQNWWSGSPFHQVGKNSILIYIGCTITKNALPWSWTPIDYTTHAWTLWMSTWSTCLWIIIAVILDWWRIYLVI